MCRSLQATWIQNILLRALRVSTTVNVKDIPRNIAYQHPRISLLATLLSRVASTLGFKSQNAQEIIGEMHALVEKYGATFPHRQDSTTVDEASGQDVILLTGSTGGLGAALLDQLVRDPDVSHVFALNRRASDGASLICRQQAILRERGYNIGIASSPKVTLLEVDFTVSDLGLSCSDLENVSVRHISHESS